MRLSPSHAIPLIHAHYPPRHGLDRMHADGLGHLHRHLALVEGAVAVVLPIHVAHAGAAEEVAALHRERVLRRDFAVHELVAHGALHLARNLAGGALRGEQHELPDRE